MEEYNTRILTSELNWYENGDLVSNPEFSANMEMIQKGINENYKDIQDLQKQAENFVEIDKIKAGDNISVEKKDKEVHISAILKAEKTSVADAANYYNSKTVEGILQELGLLIFTALEAQSEVVA